MGKTVLILGGGTGGVVAANVLSKTLSKEHRILVVDRNDTHFFRASYPLVIVHKRQPQQIIKKLELLKRKRIQFIQADVNGVYPELRQVKTNEGMIQYDYLVIALGAEHHPETVPGQSELAYNPLDFKGICRLRQALALFEYGRIVLFISNIPYTGVIAPYEIMFLLDAYFRKRNIRHQVDLVLVTPEPSLLPLAGPKVGKSLQKMMEQQGIKVIKQAKVLSLNPKTKHLVLDGGITIPGDVFIGVPSHWGPSPLRESGLTIDGGWIEVDPYTLETRNERVYAVGDATATKLPITESWAPKAGVFAHYQAEVVARNIALMLAGKPPRFRFTGKASGAVIATGMGHGRVASINYYAKPNPRFILLRTTRMAYWMKIAFEKYWLSRWF